MRSSPRSPNGFAHHPGQAPLVTVDEFFDGNDDRHSIGANLDPHPGIPTFHRVLWEIEARPDVQSVLLVIHEWPYADDGEDAEIWPDSDTVLVLTSASRTDVQGWVAPLRPSDVIEEAWGNNGGVPLSDLPPLADGMALLTVWWD
jgi:hypothetical protein